MHVPESIREIQRDDALVRTVDAGDNEAIVIDFGSDAETVSADVLAETVIVVVGERQYEFDLPPDASDVTLNNGVLTIVD